MMERVLGCAQKSLSYRWAISVLIALLRIFHSSRTAVKKLLDEFGE
jgi:hypothetical protein